MTEEESIEKFLNYVKDRPTMYLYEDCKAVLGIKTGDKDGYKITDLKYTLQVYNLVEKTTNDDPYFMLSKLGRQVIKEGGWVKHLQKKKRIDLIEKLIKFYLPIISLLITMILGV